MRFHGLLFFTINLIDVAAETKDDALLAEKYNIGTGFDVLLFAMIVR